MTSLYKHCKNCGKDLGNNATWRKEYCSDKCRVAFHRTSSAQALYGEGIRAITKLGGVAAGQKKAAIASLKDLRKAIDDQLRVLGDVDTIDKYEMLAGNHSIKRVRCRNCGQSRYTVPVEGDKCAFCGSENWNIQ